MTEHKIHPIAKIHTEFPTKFGVPRQSGLVDELKAEIVFEPAYRNEDALRGLEGFSHLWLIWHFSQVKMEQWSPTVRPPRLGGNTRVGVFATRSPFRPNTMGLSSVKLLEIRKTEDRGTVLIVGGADLMDGTPIFDIKPYIPSADCHPDAKEGFTSIPKPELEVVIPEEMLERISLSKREALIGVLRQDPRPAYQKDPERIYGFRFGAYEVRFHVSDGVARVDDFLPV